MMISTQYDYTAYNEPTRIHFCTFLDLLRNLTENNFSYIYSDNGFPPQSLPRSSTPPTHPTPRLLFLSLESLLQSITFTFILYSLSTHLTLFYSSLESFICILEGRFELAHSNARFTLYSSFSLLVPMFLLVIFFTYL